MKEMERAYSNLLQPQKNNQKGKDVAQTQTSKGGVLA